jgi:hypothetical protein
VPYLHTDITLQRVSSIRVPRTVVNLFMAAKVGGAGVGFITLLTLEQDHS